MPAKKKAVKKKSVVKKPSARAQSESTKSLINYDDSLLIPADDSILHPIYFNSPDVMHVMPKALFEVPTGLEIAIPPNMVLMASINVPGSIQASGGFHGYQKELTLKLWNITSLVAEIEPYQKIGHIFLAEIKPWK